MGLLDVGQPLDWDDSVALLDKVRRFGVLQFISAYERCKDYSGDVLLWGDEIEYAIVKLDAAKRRATLSCKAQELLTRINGADGSEGNNPFAEQIIWHPEYATFMMEGTPAEPYRCYAADLLLVEANMRLRRLALQKELDQDEFVLSIVTFPTMGAPGITSFTPSPESVGEPATHGQYADSDYLPDSIINPHPRFGTLTRNIRKRRGEKVDIRVPLFQDTYTNPSALPGVITGQGDSDHPQASDASIHMDCMGFGMGMNCLQVTMQCRDVGEARDLYDQLAVLGAPLLALSAATPFFRGLIAGTDCRWNALEQSVDCRTADERKTVRTSRYSSIDCYIANTARHLPEYDDVEVKTDAAATDELLKAGMDPVLARHVSHLFIRDPMVVFEGGQEGEAPDLEATNHFENFNSTNWNIVRFKPPPAGSNIGWRVEFRTPDVQLTDFENAAFSIFVVLLSRVILAFGLNFYVPISKLDDNMQRAHSQDAVKKQKFWFRRCVSVPKPGEWEFRTFGGENISAEAAKEKLQSLPRNVQAFLYCNPRQHGAAGMEGGGASSSDDERPAPGAASLSETVELTLDELFNGVSPAAPSACGEVRFPGLVPLIRIYLEMLQLDEATAAEIERYMMLIQKRASGELCTNATWLRNMAVNHPDYKGDSVITEAMNHDLMSKCVDLSHGVLEVPEMLGDLKKTPDWMLHSSDEEGSCSGSPKGCMPPMEVPDRHVDALVRRAEGACTATSATGKDVGGAIAAQRAHDISECLKSMHDQSDIKGRLRSASFADEVSIN